MTCDEPTATTAAARLLRVAAGEWLSRWAGWAADTTPSLLLHSDLTLRAAVAGLEQAGVCHLAC